MVTAAVSDWYGRFADGRPGGLVVEATGIRDTKSGPLLRIGHDRFVPGLARLVRHVRERSEGETRLFLQILDFLTIRRRPQPEKYFHSYWTPRPEHREALRMECPGVAWDSLDPGELAQELLRAGPTVWARVLTDRELESLQFGYRERVTDVDVASIRELPEVLPGLFADAAARAKEAGFDGVELHYAHAYTMASFLSAGNDRGDGYGGSLDGRARLPLEVLKAVRRRVSDDFAVGIRFLGDEVIEGGSTVRDAVAFGQRFALAGANYLSISKGGKFEDSRQPKIGEARYPYTGLSGLECMPTVRSDERGPFGRNVPLASEIRSGVQALGLHCPVIAAGGLCEFQQMEGVLRAGEADLVAAARQSLADPDFWRKMRLGRGEEIRRCTFTNYCEGLDQRHKEVTCKLWDREDLTSSPGLSKDGRRRLVAPPWKT